MLNLAIFVLQALLAFDASNAGSCFQTRLPNGRCHGLIARDRVSPSECCRSGGFYVNGHLTQEQFVRDLLLQRKGVSNCQYSCQSGYESCNGVNCQDGFQCKLRYKKAVCVCSSLCTLEDYQSGPVCTTDFRQFRNRCSFIKNRCRNLDTLLTEMKCPFKGHVCPNKGNIGHLADHNSDLPVKICPQDRVCIVRQYSGKASCEDPNESPIDGLDSCDSGPICSTENITYSNECLLRKASIDKGIEIRIAYRGPCKENAKCGQVRCQSPHMTCLSHVATGQPVCLDCRDLPPNCNPQVFTTQNISLETAEMTLLHALKEKQQNFGDPQWHGEVLTNDWPMVCGSGKQSFPNACFLHVYNCLAKHFVDITSTGFCPVE